eukprot:1159380-Pelagomonas_calceolata.AAC.7
MPAWIPYQAKWSALGEKEEKEAQGNILMVPPAACHTLQVAMYEQPSPLQTKRPSVAKLKASRDKLLEQIDKQWEELDRVGMEFKAASDELASTRRLAANWEAQAQDSLAHVDRLKVGLAGLRGSGLP